MRKKHSIILAILLVCVFVCMITANSIQTDGGNVQVSIGSFTNDVGELTMKLYIPKTASDTNPAPAVLLLHGYQNDHETCGAYAIELARRGVVVLALDEYGHGTTDPGMANRGWTNHKVTVNYGNDSEADGTFKTIGGAQRYRLMMNFSNLKFFNDKYSKGTDGSELKDSSMGGIDAYEYLASLPYVDATRIGVSGHSMGTWASWSVDGELYNLTNAEGEDISPKATVLQCGELFRDSAYDSAINFNNVLLLQAKYDEFNYFRDYTDFVTDDLLTTPLRLEFLDCEAKDAAWNTTFGSFEDGTARRIEFLNTNHRLTTHNHQGMTAAIDWFTEALGIDTALQAGDHVYMIKEWLVFAAMLLGIFAMLPLMELLLTTKLFAPVAGTMPEKPVKSKGKWWKAAIITVILSAATYPFMTQLGHGLLPLPENIFRMTIGNGFLSWYLLLIIIMIVTTITGGRKAKKNGESRDWADLGLANTGKAGRLDWALLGRAALLVICMVGGMYILVIICEALFTLDFRFIWPFFKGFTCTRFMQFLVYYPIFALFFICNNSKIFAQNRVAAAAKPGAAGFLGAWWRYALCMVGGILVVILIEYIPFFAGIGPGADLLFGTTFGGPFMSLLIVFAPQVLVFSLLCTYIYRRTANVYTGALTVAALACWVVTGGSAMF